MVRTVVPLLLLLLVVSCHACTEVIINDADCSNGPVVSARTMDFAAELGPRVTAAPASSKLRLLPLDKDMPSTCGDTIAVKHAFVCISHLPAVLQQLYPADDPINQIDHAFCIDGLNAKGLSAAVLYQGDTKTLPVYDPDSARSSAINLLDLPAFLLARYATVADIEVDLKQHIQVVWSPTYNALGRLITGNTQDAAPYHITVHDRSGASLVIQFRDGQMEVLRNPLGVFTNHPLLQEQLENYQTWLSKHNYTTDTKPRGEQWIMPGDYSSPSRFVRLAMIKTATSRDCWPTTVQGEVQRLSPGYVPPGYPSASPALLAVLGIQQSVYLPRGINDDGGADAPSVFEDEVTPYSTLRDHTSATFYYRSAALGPHQPSPIHQIMSSTKSILGGDPHAYTAAIASASDMLHGSVTFTSKPQAASLRSGKQPWQLETYACVCLVRYLLLMFLLCRTGNSVLFRSVAVRALDTLSSRADPQLVHTPLLPPRQAWVIDDTRSVISAPNGQQPHMIQQSY